MVNKCMFIMFALIISFGSAYAAPVDISAEVQADGAYENQPLKGTITISHSKNDPIDNGSFLIDKDKLAVDFVKDVRIDPNDPTVLSIYNFQLPGKPQGLYALPPISVKIGGKNYQSVMSSYTVLPRPGQQPQSTSAPSIPNPTPPATTNTINEVEPSLHLEAGVDGRTTLYPGQTTRFFYRYIFTGNIGLTTEVIPLLDAEGFLKIGEKEIKDSTQNGKSVSEISQVVRAVKPGKYSFGPSKIEGYATRLDSLGHPVYTSAKMSSDAPIVEVTVLPFPEKSKPASFNGAVGKFTFKTELLSSPKVEVGDDVSLAMTVSGKGNFKSFQLPDLCCQPGFSGFFLQSDLPPKEVEGTDTKQTIVQLRVLTEKIKEIPSVEFSYFDPEDSKYVILRSSPIPIEVKPVPLPTPSARPFTLPPKETAPASKSPPAALSAASPIEIESIIPLTTSDLYNLRFGTWWVLAIVPIGLVLLIFQAHLKDYMDWRSSKATPVTSRELFQKAFAQKGKCNFDLLMQSLKLALIETGRLPPDTPAEELLPTQGTAGEVKDFMAALDEKRFGGKEPLDIDAVQKQASALYDKIVKEAPYAEKP